MKPIKLTEKYLEELKANLLKDLEKELNLDTLRGEADSALKKLKMADGLFSFRKDFKFEQKFTMNSSRRANIAILPEAYAKIITILMTNDKEVAWHAVTERVSETEFVVKDILIYPQQVTAVTVDTDDEEYASWLIGIGEENFMNLHGQMHSHVHMGVSPSGTDMGHREKIIAQLTDEDYYIFMIWNKRLEWSAAIYDMPSNALYETSDIDVTVMFEDGTTAGDLVREMKEKVTTQVTTYAGGYKGATYYPGAQKKEEPARKWWEKKGENGAGNGPDEFRYQYSGYQYDHPYDY